MRKVWLVLTITAVLTLAFSTLTMASNKIMVNYDMKGRYETSEDNWWDKPVSSYDTESGYVIGYEYTNDTQRTEFGFGFESQLDRGLTNSSGTEFNFNTLYGVMYIHIANKKDFAPFIVGRIGYNMHSNNDTFKKTVYSLDMEMNDGMYGALGFGFNAERGLATFLYSVNCGSITSNTDSEFKRSLVYSKFSIVFGFRF